MASFWRMSLLIAVAAQVSLYHTAEGRRLLLGEDGFARVDGPSTAPVAGITVSSWVNITEFPGGVAPMVTIISEDASYQIAFFIRHDGAGVLWGGPAPLQQPQIEKVDRHPRSRYGNGRKRRSADDYSMGLGDVMNIMTRKERSNTWTPMNFVDVSEMGVADLETSGSETQNHYENWYDVGYELQMQESANPEPKIITQPSGKNDFVVINWNGHNPPPLSTNQWDPVNESPQIPDFSRPQVATKILPPANEKFVWSQEESGSDGGWTSQVLPSNADAQGSAIIRDFVPTTITTTEKTTRSRPSRPFIPDLRRPGVRESIKTKRPIDGFRYSQRRTPEPTTATRTTTTTPTTTATPPTTTSSTTTARRPTHVNLEKVTTDTRVPLWARLKQTSVEEINTKEEPVATTTTTHAPRVRETTRHPVTRLRLTETSRPFIHRTTTTTAPIVDIRVPSATTTKRPPITTYRTTKQSSTKSKERKTYNNLSSKSGITTKSYSQRPNSPLSSHSLDEFKKVLEGKPKIEDTGNKVVVYSMPITDVEAFNRMYEQYQESVARQSPRINLHAVYDLAREGQDHPALNEDETNQNRLEQVPEPLPVLTYKEEPLHYAESEPAPIIIKETELVAPIIETEQVVPLYEDTAFRPSNLDQIGTLERDYTYYPYSETPENPEPIEEDESAQPSKTRYEIELPEPEESASLPVLELQPTLYETALPVQQDIGGQQASFYQEPSRISHEQLPPEYTAKSEKVSKNKFAGKRPEEILRTRVTQGEIPNTFANAQPNQPIPQTKPIPFPSADQILKTEAFIMNNQNVLSIEEARPTEATPSPVRINAVPIFTQEDPADVTEVPLNVNFRKMPYSFDLNTWYHLAFAWSSQDHVLRIYINGQLAGILEGTIPDLQALPTNGMMLLGKTLLPSLTGFDPTSHLTGEMSNFVVWSEALTPPEVDNVFSCGKPPVHPVLLAWNSSPLRVYNDAVVQQAPPICGISS